MSRHWKWNYKNKCLGEADKFVFKAGDHFPITKFTSTVTVAIIWRNNIIKSANKWKCLCGSMEELFAPKSCISIVSSYRNLPLSMFAEASLVRSRRCEKTKTLRWSSKQYKLTFLVEFLRLNLKIFHRRKK